MSRSGYSNDMDNAWDLIRWRGAVASAIRGARGQAFLKEMLAALDKTEPNRLIANELSHGAEVCAIGAVGVARGIDMSNLDPEDRETVAGTFGISPALAAEIVFMNDEGGFYKETPEARYTRMRCWIESHLKQDNAQENS